MASLAGSLKTISIVEAARVKENMLKVGLGELKFSPYHTKNVTKISKQVCIIDVLQESEPVSEYGVDRKTLTREELLNMENPGLVVKALDPMTSSTMSFTLTQSIMERTPFIRNSRLLALNLRSQLAKFVANKAVRIFAFEEKNGRLQMVLAGETDEATQAARVEARIHNLEKLMGLKKQLEEKKRKLQNECRVIRLEEYRQRMVEKREVLERKNLVATVREWQCMHKEDVIATQLRTFLTCDSSTLNEIRLAFEVFDLDGNGTINATEFQALVFELGEVMTERELAEAMKKIDLDGNGVVQFHEFAVWWVEKPISSSESNDSNRRMLELKLKMLKRAKNVMARMGAIGIGGGGNRARKKQKKDILQPLKVSRETDQKDGLMGKIFGGGADKSSRPKTV